MRKLRIVSPASVLVVLVSMWAGDQFAASAASKAPATVLKGSVKPADTVTSHGGTKKNTSTHRAWRQCRGAGQRLRERRAIYQGGLPGNNEVRSRAIRAPAVLH